MKHILFLDNFLVTFDPTNYINKVCIQTNNKYVAQTVGLNCRMTYNCIQDLLRQK